MCIRDRNKADPNYSLCRATENRGQNAHTDGKFGLSDQGCMEPVSYTHLDVYKRQVTDRSDDLPQRYPVLVEHHLFLLQLCSQKQILRQEMCIRDRDDTIKV